jgi:DNA polymerase zeta
VNRYVVKLAKSLNHAIGVSLKRHPQSPNSQFVRAVLIVKGVHFYGFHAAYSPFLKIIIADPALITRAVALMQSGSIMKTRFRVFESHLGYLLQFMCDFGLYGCGWIDLDDVWQRGSEIEQEVEDGEASVFKASPLFRESRMALEVDVASHQILNRLRLGARNIHHELKIPSMVTPDEPLVPSVKELWEDERSRRLASGLSPSPELPIDPSENSRGPGGNWDAGASLWDEVNKRIEQERANGSVLIQGESDWERWIMTTFESVEALWEEPWRVWNPSPSASLEGKDGKNLAVEDELAENPFEMMTAGSSPRIKTEESTESNLDVDFDEDFCSSQEMNNLVELEDGDWEKFFEQNAPAEGENEEEDFHQDEPPDNLPLDPASTQLTHGDGDQNPSAFVRRRILSSNDETNLHSSSSDSFLQDKSENMHQSRPNLSQKARHKFTECVHSNAVLSRIFNTFCSLQGSQSDCPNPGVPTKSKFSIFSTISFAHCVPADF